MCILVSRSNDNFSFKTTIVSCVYFVCGTCDGFGHHQSIVRGAPSNSVVFCDRRRRLNSLFVCAQLISVPQCAITLCMAWRYDVVGLSGYGTSRQTPSGEELDTSQLMMRPYHACCVAL